MKSNIKKLFKVLQYIIMAPFVLALWPYICGVMLHKYLDPEDKDYGLLTTILIIAAALIVLQDLVLPIYLFGGVK